MKLADLQKKRARDLDAARKRVLGELAKLEKQALKSLTPFTRAVAALAPALKTAEKAAALGPGELAAAWGAALKARERYATAHDEMLLGLDDSLELPEKLSEAFDYVGSDLPAADDVRESLEAQIRETFESLRDVVAQNLEVE